MGSGMSIPSDDFSLVEEYIPFQFSIPSDQPFVSYHFGGVGFKDTSEGLLYQVWKLRQDFEGFGNLYLSNESDDFDAETFVAQIPFSNRINLSFNTNMDIVIGYQISDEYTIRYADPDYKTITFDDVQSALLCIDHPGILCDSYRDVFMAYIRFSDKKFCYRLSSEDYGTAHETSIVMGAHQYLRQIGLNRQNRFQVEVLTR
jgi:hypothetical protein